MSMETVNLNDHNHQCNTQGSNTAQNTLLQPAQKRQDQNTTAGNKIIPNNSL